MIKKDLSKQDKEDWQDFIDNHSPIPNKDGLRDQKNNAVRKFKFDFHGYTIAGANKKINEIINSCYEKGVSEILIITGKGIHSKSKTNVYASKELSTLKNTIPDFLKAGAEILVLGSSGLFIKNLTIKDAVNEIHESIDKVL